jgi:hypothetical protein
MENKNHVAKSVVVLPFVFTVNEKHTVRNAGGVLFVCMEKESHYVENVEGLRFVSMIKLSHVVKHVVAQGCVKLNFVKQPEFKNIMVIAYLVVFKFVQKLRCVKIIKLKKKM